MAQPQFPARNQRPYDDQLREYIDPRLSRVTITEGDEVTSIDSLNYWTVPAPVNLTLPDAPEGTLGVVYTDSIDRITWPAGTVVIGRPLSGGQWMTLAREESKWRVLLSTGSGGGSADGGGLPVHHITSTNTAMWHPLFQNPAGGTAAAFADFFGTEGTSTDIAEMYLYIEQYDVPSQIPYTRLRAVVTSSYALERDATNAVYTRDLITSDRLSATGAVLMVNAAHAYAGLAFLSSDYRLNPASLSSVISRWAGLHQFTILTHVLDETTPQDMTSVGQYRGSYPTAVKTVAALSQWAAGPNAGMAGMLPDKSAPVGACIFVEAIGKPVWKSEIGKFVDATGAQVFPA